jgi:hypothetical protein
MKKRDGMDRHKCSKIRITLSLGSSITSHPRAWNAFESRFEGNRSVQADAPHRFSCPGLCTHAVQCTVTCVHVAGKMRGSSHKTRGYEIGIFTILLHTNNRLKAQPPQSHLSVWALALALPLVQGLPL